MANFDFIQLKDHKSNNDPIKLFTVEVKDLITTEEIMMLGELSMDD
ncbi:17214_t:CDS:2 [Entrophospora sp. SA101]|nr:17214_t:CDS:2 [Entrophospora sp. SA101]